MIMKVIFILLLNLDLIFRVQAIRESIPMKSLSCYNDYNSQVTCTWMEHSEAHALVGMILYQRNDFIEENEEMFCKRQTENDSHETSDSYVRWVCHNTTEGFVIGVKDIYSFKPNKILQAELNVDLFQNVQTLPPQNLSVSSMTSGDFLLTWKAADGSQGLGNALEYEVTYKREWESWEKAASLVLSNTTSCRLHHKDLVPGSSYVARVRARPGQASGFSGQYSEWSMEVSWETPEGGLQPRNLRCLFDGADRLTCSWEVKKAITTSVLFGLFFRATPASAEEECFPVREKALPHVPYVIQSCEIPVNNSSSQSQYHVSVQAKTEEKIIEAYKNIKVLPPANVSVTVTENQEYELRWTKYALRYSFIKQRYQVEYWKNNQYKTTAQKLNISNDEPPFIFTLEMLASSTEYRGKMRARVNTPLDYEGPWSEWSEEFTWKTDNVLPPVVLPAMLPALIIIFLIAAYCSYRYFLRKKQMWEEKIPNPSKSLLIQSYQGKVHLGNWPTSSLLDFNKYNFSEKMEQASFLQVVDRQMKTLAESSEGQAKKTDVSPAALDLQNSYHALNEPEHAPVVCSSHIAGHSFPVSRRNSADAGIASQVAVPCFAFNGPYLYSPVMSSQPDVHQTLEVDPVGVREKSVSLQYVTLPKEDCPQAPQKQEQPGADPSQPFLHPDQKEMMRHIDHEQEVSLAPPASGKGTNVRREEQKSPKALSCITSPQQRPLEYITTESLSLPSASDSTHPPLVTAGELPCDSQEPQPSSDHSCHEFSPGKTGVMVPVSGQAPTSSPELQPDTFEDYLTVPLGLHGHSEPTKISFPILQKGNDLLRKQPLPEGNLVVLNPDSTEPVFLCQVGDYCFHSLKSSVKMDISQDDHQIKKPSEGKTTPGKPVSDDEAITGKEKDVSKMQAIQLFKNLKSDDYFSWQQSLRITEIC
ncbi:cytokine receptor common subunit beta-like isoform X1 [Rissa tridactyla]|uniref:cytokine receptor common subunit beta-like isoform X1 n=2 Tax=Rissa tridactyla TaxID=75485 RepID=UPI0023BAFDF4|nr:cytokine receptor common subunit beta-like isoform X1 [Rissa tridactyla]XP_054064921.1 cytokine receptor common subunit beta-like isoform X1 [Rissa tridactyla]XP_054064932.1 cytokine receptor common subunit beta-like isoform X1 [Rissa tridactyla]